MSGFNQNLLTEKVGPVLRDYTHASLTFRTNNYQNAPKLKFLFHVYFEINQEAYTVDIADANYGLLVKTVKLPSFNIDVSTLNQYNRKRLIQTKIKYDPVDITFHDDNGTATNTPNSGGVIRSLWKAYYNYYYADGRNPEVVFDRRRLNGQGSALLNRGQLGAATATTYNERNQYAESITGNANWGYMGESLDETSSYQLNTGGKKIPFFKNITVFGLSQHRFAAYTLINPIITSFSHDTYDYSSNEGVMENKMTLDYETVVYNDGDLNGEDPANIVTGFGEKANYDKELSPIARKGSNRSVAGPWGLVEGGGVSANDGVAGEQAAQIAYNFQKQNGLTDSQVAIQESKAVDQPSSTRNLIAQYPSFQATGNGLVSKSPTANDAPGALGGPANAGSQNGPVYSN
jgi:hypothetical protein